MVTVEFPTINCNILKFNTLILKNYCTTSSAWPKVELRFSPWCLLFKYWTEQLNLTLFLLCVSLVMANRWEETFFYSAICVWFGKQRRERESKERGDLRSGWGQRTLDYQRSHLWMRYAYTHRGCPSILRNNKVEISIFFCYSTVQLSSAWIIEHKRKGGGHRLLTTGFQKCR